MLNLIVVQPSFYKNGGVGILLFKFWAEFSKQKIT
jgi:hypothetical protein